MQSVAALIICNWKTLLPLLTLGILMHILSMKVASFSSTLKNEVDKHSSCHTVNFLCISIRKLALFSASSAEILLYSK